MKKKTLKELTPMSVSTSSYAAYTSIADVSVGDIVEESSKSEKFDVGGLAKDITSKPGSAALKKEVAEAAVNLEKLFKELDTIRDARDKAAKVKAKKAKVAKAKAERAAKALKIKRDKEVALIEVRHLKEVTAHIKGLSPTKLQEALISFFEWEDNYGEIQYSKNFEKHSSNLFKLTIESISKLGTTLKPEEANVDKEYEYKGYNFKHYKGDEGFWRVEDSKTVLFESV